MLILKIKSRTFRRFVTRENSYNPDLIHSFNHSCLFFGFYTQQRGMDDFEKNNKL